TLIGTALTNGSGNWSFTPGTVMVDGTHNLTVTATDVAGNVSGASLPLSITVETVRPTASLSTGSGTVTPGATIAYSLSFSEGVTGLDPADFSISNGSIQSITGSGSSYTVNVSAGSSAGAVSLTLNNGSSVTDAAGNTTTGASNSSVNVVVDVDPPTASLIGSGTVKGNAAVSYALNFSEWVSGVDVGDFSISNGMIESVTGSGSSYTVNVKASATSGAIGLTLLNGTSIFDAYNNRTVGTSNSSVTVDATAPTGSLSTGSTAVGPDAIVSYSLNFSEPVLDLTMSDFSVSNGVIQTVSGNGSSYTITVKAGSTTGNIALLLPTGAVTDQVGNANPAISHSGVGVNATKPTATLSGSGTVGKGALVNYSLSFSQSVTGLATNDFSVTNGAIQSVTGSGSTYTVAVTAGSTSGPISLALADRAASDGFGNASVATSNSSVNVDATPPKPTISSGSSLVAPGTTVNYSVTFDESVLDLDLSDFAASNATLSGLSGSGSSYTLSVKAGSSGTIGVALGAGTVKDLYGNASTLPLYDGNVRIQPAPPAPAIKLASDSQTDGDFYTKWDAVDVSNAVAGGTIQYSLNGGSTWTNSGTRIAPSGLADGVRNMLVRQQDSLGTYSGNSSITYTVDTKSPTVTISPQSSSVASGGTISYSITFSEAVEQLTASDFTVSGVAGSTVGTLTGSGSSYTLSVTAGSGTGTLTLTLPGGNGHVDHAGNDGVGGAASVTVTKPNYGPSVFVDLLDLPGQNNLTTEVRGLDAESKPTDLKFFGPGGYYFYGTPYGTAVGDALTVRYWDKNYATFEFRDPQGASGFGKLLAPIVLDLNGNGFDLLRASMSRPTVDVNNDGVRDHTGWVDAQDGILVFDKNGDGKASDKAEIELAAYGKDGASDLEGLAQGFDSNHDGVFDAQDAQWASFGVWRDLNQDGIGTQDEFQSLEAIGIVSIQLHGDNTPHSINGNGILSTVTFGWKDGSVGAAGDAVFNYVSGPEQAQQLSETLPATAESAVIGNVVPAAEVVEIVGRSPLHPSIIA
ncbi:beta strand repeat-containing protein, partial [Pseudoduganella ginsengisoli]|uniref:beta strand repeat-containing protein n=1 Tax=Pseudoduganella ginsengisoli TaxID=1462440 RepID=UPI001E2A4A36